MRVITDTNKAVHLVEVLLSREELAARLGYSGLRVTSLFIEGNGYVQVTMQNGEESACVKELRKTI